MYSSETPFDTQRTTRRYIPEDSTLHNHRFENLKSYNIILIYQMRYAPTAPTTTSMWLLETSAYCNATFNNREHSSITKGQLKEQQRGEPRQKIEVNFIQQMNNFGSFCAPASLSQVYIFVLQHIDTRKSELSGRLVGVCSAFPITSPKCM
jgi:hypothetical protein